MTTPRERPLPRGIRLNNPGNIRHNDSVKWIGALPVQDDPAFVHFASPQHGIRALARTLLTYYRKHALTTITEIIGRWAPTSENDTPAYIRSVSNNTRLDPLAPLNLLDSATLRKLVVAITIHENGMQPYEAFVIDAGVSSALGA